MSPRIRKGETSKDAPGATKTVVSVSEYKNTLQGLSQAAYARFMNIRDRVYEIRKRFSLSDLDTARLYKRFFDEPDGIGNRVQQNVLGLLSRHYGWSAGVQVDKQDWRFQEFRAVVVWSSPLNLDAFDGDAGVTPNDIEAMLQPLLTFPCPDWTAGQEVVDYVNSLVPASAKFIEASE